MATPGPKLERRCIWRWEVGAGVRRPENVSASPSFMHRRNAGAGCAKEISDKVGITRAIGAVSLLGAPITAFGGLDNVTKAIVAGVAVVAILLLLRGEQIAARTKAILRSFES